MHDIRALFLRTVAAIAALVLASSQAARAGSIVGGSALLSLSDVSQLETWLGEGPLTLTNAYTKAAGHTATTFHNAVDGIGRTFFVGEFTADPPYTGGVQKLGGYNPASWSSIGDYNLTPDVEDMDAFVFNLTQSFMYEQVGPHQTMNEATYGPTFGGGHDLWINSFLDFGYVFAQSYCTPGVFSKPSHCVGLNPGGNLTGQQTPGQQFGAWGRIEVFTISHEVVPEPTTALLVCAGLAGMARTRRPRSS